MDSSSSQFVSSRNIGVYDPMHQFSIWEEHFKTNGDLSASMSLIDEADMKLNNQVRVQNFTKFMFMLLLHMKNKDYFPVLIILFYVVKDASYGILGTSIKFEQEGNKITNKVRLCY